MQKFGHTQLTSLAEFSLIGWQTQAFDSSTSVYTGASIKTWILQTVI